MVTEAEVRSALERLQADPREDFKQWRVWLARHREDVLVLVQGKGRPMAADLIGCKRHVLASWLEVQDAGQVDGTKPQPAPEPAVQQEPVKDQAADEDQDVVTKDYLEGQIDVYRQWVESLQIQLAEALRPRGGP